MGLKLTRKSWQIKWQSARRTRRNELQLVKHETAITKPRTGINLNTLSGGSSSKLHWFPGAPAASMTSSGQFNPPPECWSIRWTSRSPGRFFGMEITVHRSQNILFTRTPNWWSLGLLILDRFWLFWKWSEKGVRRIENIELNLNWTLNFVYEFIDDDAPVSEFGRAVNWLNQEWISVHWLIKNRDQWHDNGNKTIWMKRRHVVIRVVRRPIASQAAVVERGDWLSDWFIAAQQGVWKQIGSSQMRLWNYCPCIATRSIQTDSTRHRIFVLFEDMLRLKTHKTQ